MCNANWEKYFKYDKNYEKLVVNAEKYIKQAMTGHTCGQEIGGNPKFYGSSDCKGCCPETMGHYRNAADMVIAWTRNWVEMNIMKNVLLKNQKGAKHGR